MIGIGFIALIGAFTLYFFSYEIWHFYLGGALLGAGTCLTGTAVVAYVIGKWFPKNKGTIMGITLAANGFGGMVSELVITNIVYNSEQLKQNNGLFTALCDLFGVDGWRLACILTACLFVIIGIVVILFVRNQPKGTNNRTDLPQNTSEKQAKSKVSIAPILGKPYFYLSGICVFLVGFILQSSSGIAKSHMLDVGISAEYLVAVFSLSSLMLACAKMLNGVLFDRFGIRPTYIFCCVCGISSIIALAFTVPDSSFLAWVYSIVHAFGMPLETVMIPLLVSAMFQEKYYATILGYYLAFNMLGYATGIPFINLFYDTFGTYQGILIAFAIVLAIIMTVSLFSMQLAKKDKQSIQEAGI